MEPHIAFVAKSVEKTAKWIRIDERAETKKQMLGEKDVPMRLFGKSVNKTNTAALLSPHMVCCVFMYYR